MRILFLSMEYPPKTPGGIGSYVSSAAVLLARRGHQVHVLCCVPGQEESDTLMDGVWVHRRGQILRRAWSRLERSPSFCRLRTALSCRLEQSRLAWQPEIIEAPEYMAESLLSSRRIPLTVTLHSPISVVTKQGNGTLGLDGRLADWLESRAARRADVITSPSKLLADLLDGQGWMGRREVTIISNPIDLERLPSPSPRTSTPPHVLAVGRIESRKAPEVLIRAASLLQEAVEGLEVTFVGRSSGQHEGIDYAEYVRRTARDLGVVCRVVNEVPRDELSAWYAAARVVAVPSRFDNYPMAALEAMAHGRPVVCTTSTGVAPMLTDIARDAVVPPDDPAALATALAPYLLDDTKASEAGFVARQHVERLTKDSIRSREAAYLKAVQRQKTGRRRSRPLARRGRYH